MGLRNWTVQITKTDFFHLLTDFPPSIFADTIHDRPVLVKSVQSSQRPVTFGQAGHCLATRNNVYFYRLSPFTLDLAQIWILVNAIFESNGALVRKKETKRNEIPKNDIQKLHEEFLKLFENYDKRIRPGLGAPLPVTVNMLVQSISKLDQVDMRYEMGVFLRQEWTDSRLDFRAGYI